MNRLVIIGNGFDLAHGLKTSYEDFLVDLVISRLKAGVETTNDLLFDVIYQDVNYDKPIDWSSINSIEELKVNPRIYIESISLREKRNAQYVIKINSEFFKRIIKECNWTDIEKLYFNILIKDCLLNNGEYGLDQVNELNKHFEIIKKKLGVYIAKRNVPFQSMNFNTEILETISSCDTEPLNEEHQNKMFKHLKVIDTSYSQIREIENVLFVNFNYTTLLANYLQQINLSHFDLINIHGTIDSNSEIEDSLIFGYGDDTHEKYSLLENQDENELLKHIKPFYYPNSSSYSHLIDFINETIFDVYVIGHSLGLSDRVLLKTIFEHKKCNAIKLFHRGNKESQFKKRISLSRHFSDKIAMRDKILDYDVNDVFGGEQNK